jgi:tetratricopeptide (TPR) repeat protein
MWVKCENDFLGRSCALGDSLHNYTLSNKRAHEELINFKKILEYTPDFTKKLIQFEGENWSNKINTELNSTGYGEVKPLADNRIPEGRAINRSVYLEMKFTEERFTPNHRANIFIQFADSLEKENEWDKAISYADSAIAIAEDNLLKSNILMKKVRYLMKNDQSKEAEKNIIQIESMYSSYAEDYAFIIDLSMLELSLNRFDYAKKNLERSVEKCSNPGEIHFHLGELYRNEFLNNPNLELLDKAKSEYEKTLKAIPDHTRAKNMIQTISILSQKPEFK